MRGQKLHTTAEVAELFGVHPVTVRKKVAAGEWPSLVIGSRSLRFTDEHIAEIIAQAERPATRSA
ncbi:MAG: helix-turn-helix domain-containing protein [Frankiaceae bacterium]